MDVSALSPAGVGAGLPARPKNPDEAARAFETVLVRQLVQTMTKDLFKPSGSGPMAAGTADVQRDVLTDVLTEHLVAGDALRLRDLLLRQWSRDAGSGEVGSKEVGSEEA